jgi:hypothetical protein
MYVYQSHILSGMTIVNRAQIVAVPPRTLFRRAHTGKDVLLDEKITRVSVGFQPLQHRWRIHASLAESAENAIL